jgi:protein-S-isoprenylcysteine O-methyltransferase Ste14
LPSRKAPEAAFDCLLAASLVGWALFGLREYGLSSVRIAIAGLNLTVAFLLVSRSTPLESGSTSDVLKSLPALVAAGLALRLAGPTNIWPLSSRALFVLGSLVAIRSLLGLGRSFAVLPARRGLVANGPYRLVRHPVYAGELMMVCACFVAHPVPASAAVVLASLPLTALRIGTEERLLDRCEEYRCYKGQVRWRLVPGLW